MSETGRVLKVITVDSNGKSTGEWSQQLPADPFANKYQFAGLQQPPFSMEQMVFLAEQHPTHSAILEQKAADVVGTGWEWKSNDDDPSKDESQKDQLDEWFKGLAEDDKVGETTHEVLLGAWSDLETLGQGLVELSRDPSGKLRYWFRVPAHTCRFHRDGVRIAQERQGKRVWFKRWIPGDDRVVDRESGDVYGSDGDARKIPDESKRANEILVLKRPTRRSTWYGIPSYISATGWITLSTAARDDNIYFFENRREPRWAIVLENVQDDPGLEQKLKSAFKVDLRKPHRNIIIPLEGGAKAEFKQLGDNKGDLSWDKLQERADGAILLAHRMPGERVGLVRVGALGGSVVADTTRVYKESFVQTSQALLASRINRLIAVEGPTGSVAKAAEGEAGEDAEEPKWRWQPTELDLTEEGAVQEGAVKGFQGGLTMLNEAREEIGKDPLDEGDERGGKFFFELSNQAPAAPGGQPPLGEGGALAGAQEELKQHIEQLLREPPSENGFTG